MIEELEGTVSAGLERATRLRQSILQKAFAGELVAREYNILTPAQKQRTTVGK